VIDSSQSMMTRRDVVIAAGMAFASPAIDDEMFAQLNERVWARPIDSRLRAITPSCTPH
jgi:hypothetical protein